MFDEIPSFYSALSKRVRTHQNDFGLVRKTRYMYLGRTSIMNQKHEVAFSLSLLRKGIRTVTIMDDRQESEMSGTLGTILSMAVLDDILLEIQCTNGTLRISLPREQLKQIRTSFPVMK